MADPTEIKYRAFLSYSHANTRHATRLHSQLEKYRLDKELIGRETESMGPVPKSLRPIFRDREEFTGGHSLTEATIAALGASAALIVLCSPAAAASQYVNEEIRLFCHRHPDRPLIPVVVEGTPPDIFPEALRYEIDADGSISNREKTILGPDLREEGDGRQLGLAKIVAGLTGVGTDEIFQRAARGARRRMRQWITGLSAVAIALAGLAVWAEINRREAIVQRQIADERRQEAERNFLLAKNAADGLVFDIAQGLRDVEGMRTSSVAKILGTARQTIEKLVDASPGNLPLQRSRSVMLEEFGTTYLAQGNLPQALESFQASLAIRERLAKADPGGSNAGWQADLAVSYGKLGQVHRALGRDQEALRLFQAGKAIVEPLALRSQNVLWRQYLQAFNAEIAGLQSDSR